MADWDFPSFILLWDRQWERKLQQGFFQVPEYPKPEYIPLNHPSDLCEITKLIEKNIIKIEVDSAEEAKKFAEEQKLPFYGDDGDYGFYYTCRFRATVHGVPDEEWMTNFVNGKLTRLLETYNAPLLGGD